MRLVIDFQGAQSNGSRSRGIGRYTTSLTKALIKSRGDDEIFLLLNGAFENTIVPIRTEFEGFLPHANIIIWYPHQPCGSIDEENDAKRLISEAIREAFIGSLNPDVVLISSLFEGYGDDTVTSIGMYSSVFPTAVILYDLIPLIYRDIYLTNINVEKWYLKKIDHLRRADLLMSISASSGREGVKYLGFNDDQVVNISTACDSHFKPILLDSVDISALYARYGFNRPFVMYTGGIDHRKNIEGLIRAYAALPGPLRDMHQLAVVCSVQSPDRARLLQLALDSGLADGDLVLTGFVPEEDLLKLYNTCKLFVFPSWHEGFGLPALEAMACGRPVIGANTSSLPEVIGWTEALFDPYDDRAMTAKMAIALSDKAFRAELSTLGLRQAGAFSWEQSAETAWAALRRLNHGRFSTMQMDRRPRLAFVSPVPSGRSGIADYSAELLPELARYYEIDVIVEQDEPVSDPWILANCPLRCTEWFVAHAGDYERVLYQFGNSHFHGHMFDLLRHIPGIVVLHDFFLSGIAAHLDILGHNSGYWSKSLLASHGWAAVYQRFTAIDGAEVVWRYPCNLPVLQYATGVILHSENSTRLVKDWYGASASQRWALIPHLRVPTFDTDKGHKRRKLCISDDEFVVCSFGHLGPTKFSHRLLVAWLLSPVSKVPSCRLVFVGQNEGGTYGQALLEAIERSGAKVSITGWVGADAYRDWLETADAAVQLRTLSRGETSGAVLDCMNYSLPTIVNANGSLADLNEQHVIKLPDLFSDEQLAEAITVLWEQPTIRCDVGRRARAQIVQHHSPRTCADQYHRAIEQFHKHAIHGALGVAAAIKRMAVHDSVGHLDAATIHHAAQVVATNFAPSLHQRQLLIDVTGVTDGAQWNKFGAALQDLLLSSPSGWRIRPIQLNAENKYYCYADHFVCRLLQIPATWVETELAEAWAGDIVVANNADSGKFSNAQLSMWRNHGVTVFFMFSECFARPDSHGEEVEIAEEYLDWLSMAAHGQAVIACTSEVAEEFKHWLDTSGPAAREIQLPIFLPKGGDLLQWHDVFALAMQGSNLSFCRQTWSHDGAIRFVGSDSKLSTQVGVRKGRAICTTGHAGYLIFGPYIPLSKGVYRLHIAGTAKTWAGCETVDIVCDQGACQIHHIVIADVPTGNWSIDLLFTLEKNIHDFEIRFQVMVDTENCISFVKITTVT